MDSQAAVRLIKVIVRRRLQEDTCARDNALQPSKATERHPSVQVLSHGFILRSFKRIQIFV